MEQWKDVAGYEGIYQVSNEGRVRSLERKVQESNGRARIVPMRETFGYKDTYGYLCFGLCRDGERETKKVHQLVASAFIPNPDNKPQVNHKNGVKTDNRVDNLEWVTNTENAEHAYRNGLMKPPSRECIEKSASARRRSVRRSDGVIFRSIEDAAEAASVTSGAVKHVLAGRNKTAGGYSYEYIEG